MSTLAVKTLQGILPTNLITVSPGHRLTAPGHVVQVQSTTLTAAWSASVPTGTWTDVTGLTVNITPMYISSKIYISGMIYGNGQSTATQFYFKLVRNGIPVGVGDLAGSRQQITGRCYYADANVLPAGCPFAHFDSPASTSTLTYKIQVTTESSTYGIYVNRTQSDNDGSTSNGGRCASNITVMEIAQ